MSDIYGVKIAINDGKPETFWPLKVVILAYLLGVFCGVLGVVLALRSGLVFWQ